VEFKNPFLAAGQVQVAQEGFQRGCAAVGVGILILGRIVLCMRVLAAAEDFRFLLGEVRLDDRGGLRLRPGVDPLDGLLVQGVYMRLRQKQLLAREQIPHGIAHKGQ